MSYSIETLPGEPIVIIHANSEYSFAEDGENLLREIDTLLDNQKTLVYLIFDVVGISVSLDEVIFGANNISRRRNLLKHPNIIKNVVVTNSSLLSFAIRGMNNPVFGSVDIRVFEQVDQAVAHVRELLSANNT